MYVGVVSDIRNIQYGRRFEEKQRRMKQKSTKEAEAPAR